MKLYSWNVNGIRAVIKKGALQQFVNDFQPDVLCLQETKAKRGQAAIDLPLYEEYWHSAEKAGYSGTAIFTKIPPKRVAYGFENDIAKHYGLTADGYGDPTKEGRVITAEFDDFFLVNVYTPNAKADLSRLKLRHEQWDPAFLSHLKMLERTKPVVVCGDFNVAHTEIDLANPKANEGQHGFTKEERAGFDSLIQAGFIDSFRIFHHDGGHYTWWTHWANARARNVGWRIDYFLVSSKLKSRVRSAAIHDGVIGSDHCPISLEVI